MIDPLVFDVGSESMTASVAEALAVVLPDRITIGLIGPLGAGKTRFVQALATAGGVEPGTVSSPTFVLIHEYHGRVPIFHFDAYRLKSDAEFLALGAEEYFSQHGWSIVEWA